jgi:hypothetical protein
MEATLFSESLFLVTLALRRSFFTLLGPPLRLTISYMLHIQLSVPEMCAVGLTRRHMDAIIIRIIIIKNWANLNRKENSRYEVIITEEITIITRKLYNQPNRIITILMPLFLRSVTLRKPKLEDYLCMNVVTIFITSDKLCLLGYSAM